MSTLSHTQKEKKTHLSPTERRNEGCEEGSGTDGRIISGGGRGDLQECEKGKDMEEVTGTMGVPLCNACS